MCQNHRTTSPVCTVQEFGPHGQDRGLWVLDLRHVRLRVDLEIVRDRKVTQEPRQGRLRERLLRERPGKPLVSPVQDRCRKEICLA